MAKRETRAEAIERADRARRDLAAYHLAVNAWQRGEAPAFETSYERLGAVVRIQAFGLDRFDGGVVVETYAYDGEVTTANVYTAERWLDGADAGVRYGIDGWQVADAAQALRAAQLEAWETRYRVPADTSSTSSASEEQGAPVGTPVAEEG